MTHADPVVTPGVGASAPSDQPPPTSDTPGRGGTSRMAAVLLSAPDVVPAAISGFAVVAVLALLLEQFRPIPVLLGGTAAAVVAAMVAIRGRDHDRVPWRELAPLGLLAVFVLGWVFVSMRLSGEFLFVWRDPGAYANAARWLVDHPSLAISTSSDVFGTGAPFDATSLGFGVVDGDAQAQGSHLLPVLLAVGAWLVGDPNFLLDGNPLIGGLALLACYGLARRVAGPWWGLVPPVALGLSMPFVAFTRDPYSEPLAVLLGVGAISLFWRAVQSRRTADFVLAGLVLGATTMVRVDAYLGVIAFLVAIVLFVAAAARGERRRAVLHAVASVLAAAGPVALGVLDAAQLSTIYWRDRAADVDRLALAAVAVVVVGVVVVALAWLTALVPWVMRRSRVLAAISAGAVVVVLLVLASRPLWWVSYQNNPPGFDSLRALQSSLGLPEEPTRSYEELSLNWLSWYYGWPMVVLAGIGLALLVHRLVRRGDLTVAFFLTATAGSALLYLHQSSIFPDQIWAMRRYLPAVIPGFLIAGAAALDWAWSRSGMLRIAAAAATAALLGVTAYSTLPMARVPSHRPALAEVESVCQALPPDAALLLVDNAGGARGGYQVTFRAFCDVPAIGLESPSADVLEEVASVVEDNGHTLYVASYDPAAVPWSDGTPDPWLETEAVKWPERLLEPPFAANFYVRDLYLGVVGPDGTVEPAPPPPDPTLDPDDQPPESRAP